MSKAALARAWIENVYPAMVRGEPLDHVLTWMLRHMLGLEDW